jgi:hypothetical protein
VCFFCVPKASKYGANLGNMIAIGLVRELGRLGSLIGRYPAISILLGLLISAPGLAGFLK